MNRYYLLWSYIVRSALFFMPDIPALMAFRGYCYQLFNKKRYQNVRIAHDVTLHGLNSLFHGNNIYLAYGVKVIGNRVQLCKDVTVGPNCVIVSSVHQFDGVGFNSLPSVQKDIVIDHGCWIGANVTILPGSVVPKYSIIGAGSVYNLSNHKERSLYVGNPSKWKKFL